MMLAQRTMVPYALAIQNNDATPYIHEMDKANNSSLDIPTFLIEGDLKGHIG